MLRLAASSRAAIRSSSQHVRSLSSVSFDKFPFLKELGLESDMPGVFDGREWKANGEKVEVYSPADDSIVGTVQWGTQEDYQRCMANAIAAQKDWAAKPAPFRGEVVRQIGLEMEKLRDPLGRLISLEMGKIAGEGVGEVQEVIDMAYLAAGMSRQIPGQVFPSERNQHTLIETWNPIGTIGIITAFNFPCAVFGWNATVSMIAGNTQIWKGAPSSNLVSIASTKIVQNVLERNDCDPAVSVLCQGGTDIGEAMSNDSRLPLISFTGSVRAGKEVAKTVAGRLGKSLLELGGNNAVIVMPDADLEMAVRSILFSAVGTAGQRCTSLRRLYIHSDVYDEIVPRLLKAYSTVRAGNPLDDGTLLGPLHNQAAVKTFEDAVAKAKSQGGKVLVGGARMEGTPLHVQPTIIEMEHEMGIIQEENFVPIMYVMKVNSYDEAVMKNNDVPQGLSSALFTKDFQNVFKWIGPHGSYCGIANVNTGSSGAEIGGAFGGEKETGGGRESGSDSWKQYMRRSTCTINHGNELPLAQGITFE